MLRGASVGSTYDADTRIAVFVLRWWVKEAQAKVLTVRFSDSEIRLVIGDRRSFLYSALKTSVLAMEDGECRWEEVQDFVGDLMSEWVLPPRPLP